jgi:hypothetical protein
LRINHIGAEVFEIFKITALLFGMFLASPAYGVWTIRGAETPDSKPEDRTVLFTPAAPRPEAVVRVPVEVITKGSAPQWVYVEAGRQAVPEPGMFSLLALTTLLIVLLRQRG